MLQGLLVALLLTLGILASVRLQPPAPSPITAAGKSASKHNEI
ncbi:MAG TPA: hypothetical protein PLU16_04180 [Gallionellaceae bacterium]|jgi:hypothetical protein|nr:hypothetical protein [Gallionellaceae bacterium]HQS74386.1 hypothetical protein [Gallionellaceae bacterium]